MIEQDVWVGIKKVDGVWRFVTSGAQFYPNKGNTLAPWDVNEPNNVSGNQNCGKIKGHNQKLDDEDCWRNKRGLCEIEIK